jgi:hypothetical protein
MGILLSRYLYAAVFSAAITTGTVTASQNEDLFIINVVHPASKGGYLATCEDYGINICRTSLTRAFELLNNSTWISSLPSQIRRVRVQLPDELIRLSNPLKVSWGREVGRGIQLEINGSKNTVVSGAIQVGSWSRVSKKLELDRINPSVADRLVYFDVPVGVLDLRKGPPPRGYGIRPSPVLTELFFRNVAQPISAWPNKGYGYIDKIAQSNVGDTHYLSIAGKTVAKWANEQDLLAHAFWRFDWSAQALLIERVDSVNDQIKLTLSPAYGMISGQRIRIENALSELDEAGEWYLDRSLGRIYFLIPVPDEAEKADYSVAENLLVFSGGNDVLIKGIAFEKSRGDAIVVNDASNIRFEGISVRNAGNRCAVIKGGRSNGFSDSIIEDCGSGGVVLEGGDRRSLLPSGHFVERSIVRRFSRLVKSMGVGIELLGVGARVEKNTISDAPHMAILFKGNDHYIIGNEIFDVVKEASDAGAVYTGRDFTAQGNVISNNMLRNIIPYSSAANVKGIYIDDQASGTLVEDNIFSFVQQPVFIGGGRNNVIRRNIFFRSSPAMHLDSRGRESQKHSTLDPRGELQAKLRSVPYRGKIYARKYPDLPGLMEDDFGYPKYNQFVDNIIVDGRGPLVSEMARSGVTISGNIFLSEESFVFKMSPSSRGNRSDFQLK